MIAELQDVLHTLRDQVGGKAWNLARLQHYGFPVPRSWVLLSQSYETLIESSPASPYLRSQEQLPKETLQEIRSYLKSQTCPNTLWKKLQDVTRPGNALAVRSSASTEDGTVSSFAGVHTSVLGVVGPEQTWSAIKECFCSLWTERAQSYRLKMGFSHAQVSCAILICIMVEAQSSGVAFTCEPVTGQRDCLRIDAVKGLGDNLVSGHINPQKSLVSFQEGKLEVTESDDTSVLDEEKLLRLARLAIRVHWALGEGSQAQDIEWSYDGKGFIILQTRPVTRLVRSTYHQISTHPIIWSNANLKDIVPGIHPTMGWNLTQGTIRSIGFASIEAVGHEVPRGMEFTRRIQGRAYLDMTALQWALYDAFGVSPSQTIREMGGQLPTIRVSQKGSFFGIQGLRRLVNRGKLAVKILKAYRQLRPAINKLEEVSRKAMTWPLESLSQRELLTKLYFLRDALNEFGHLYQFLNVGASITVDHLSMALRILSPRLAPQLLALALQGSKNMVSAAHGKRLWDLATIARQDPEALSYLRISAPQTSWRDLSKNSPFRIAFQEYLDEFGHRGVYELKLENPRWNEDPSYLLEQIRSMLDSPPPLRDKATAKHTEHWALRCLAWPSRLTRKTLISRERGKSALVTCLEPTRRIYLEIGQRLQAESVLEAPQDLFHWCWMDLESYLLDEWTGEGSKTLVSDRKKRIEIWESEEEPPDFLILDSQGRPAEWDSQKILAREIANSAESGQLQGIGVSAGRVTAVARVIHHPRDGLRLKTGEILVAPSTDPGWTPLFVRASGLITEVGGHLSHGSILAREYGLPAVVGVPNLLSELEDGQVVTVDGESGSITTA